MRTITYNFENMLNIYGLIIRNGKASISNLNDLKKELNKFFKDSECTNVYYTENVDKPFFGMCVFANITDGDNIYEYLMGNDNIRISSYMLEIDSKLFNPVMNLQPDELVAITLHEIGHLVNDSQSIVNARNYLASYLADNKEILSIPEKQNHRYKSILAYGLKDFLSKDRSIFYTSQYDEILADEFVRACGFGRALESAMDKISRNNLKLYIDSDISKFTAFAWSLRIYKGLKYRRVGALRTLARAKHLTASKIEQKEMERLAQNIRTIDDNELIEEASNPIKKKLRTMKYNTMRTLEDDFYELNMRIRNVEDEDDALYLMREINSRLSIIEDYINDGDLDENEKKRWFKTLDNFRTLRDKLSKSIVYKSKTYGIYVNYPDIAGVSYR